MTALPPVAVAAAETRALPQLPREIGVYCPFPLRSHPFDVEAIDGQAVDWCLKFRLCKPGSRATRMGCAHGIAPALRFAAESTVLAATKHFLFGSLLDDYWDSHSTGMAAHAGQLQRVMVEAPDAPLPPNDEWAASLRDLRGQLESVLTDPEFALFRREHALWLNGQLWYTELRHRGTPPEIGEWLQMRWPKVGVGTLIPFTGATMGSLQVTARQYDEPMVQAFSKATMLACAILNDIFSAAKEVAAGTGAMNLISALARAEGLDPAAAITAAWQLYERLVLAVVGLQQRLLADPRPAVARFAAELPQWIPAGLHWVSTTARYQVDGQDKVDPTPPTLVVSGAPTLWDPADRTPPPYPEIAWYWRYLK